MIPSDMGRPVTHLKMSFLGDFLAADAEKTSLAGVVTERALKHADGLHYLMRMMPYVTHGDRADGVVVTLTDVTALRREEEHIQASLREKEALLREIHHRVKNNMQIISSLMGLQAESVDDPAMHGFFRSVSDRVRSMALVHERLYQSEGFAQIEFHEYARTLLGTLWSTHAPPEKHILLVQDLGPVSLSVETAVPLGLILNELASNALKHAFAGRSEGKVTVALHADAEGAVCLGVRDNGVGFPPGFDWRQSRSLGLRLVQMLTAQLNGTVEVEGDDGTEVVIAFTPLEPRRYEE
jgi:two-component sensor histidine kinase